MELAGQQVGHLNGRGKRLIAITGVRRNHRVVVGHRKIGMHVIEIRLSSQPLPGAGSGHPRHHRVPAHVRDFQAGPLRKPAHLPPDNPQPGHPGAFLAAIKQYLIAQTNPKVGLAREHPLADCI